ncbi:hypothetical protein TELCIR_10548 [Teladorsagia circumcincta]|uniref:Centrosomal protein CEP104 Zn finger domain-containing protein n=1 Tax=Teladorsagia circumcincta TaxID=45464 RepID=A0A2G9UBU4_TELCI|nr:hypothetical protein TELCIR_10548 [Teladorsagia circumcincta]
MGRQCHVKLAGLLGIVDTNKRGISEKVSQYYMTRRLDYRAKVDGKLLDADVLSSTAWISESFEASGQLRTIYIDVVCTAVYLYVSEAHKEEIANPFDQVGLSSVLIFGRYESTAENDLLSIGTASSRGSVSSGRFTAEIDELLRRVKRNKDRTVREMDLGQAKRAQLEMNLLRKARGEMDALESDQMEAIDEEDFHRALDLQHEIKTLRGNVLSSVDPRFTTDIASSRRSSELLRPNHLFDKADHKVGTPELFTPIDLSPTDSLEKIKVRRAFSPNGSIGKNSAISGLTRTPSSPHILLRTGSASSAGLRSTPTLKNRPSSATSKVTNTTRSVPKSATLPPRMDAWHGNKFLEKENTIVPALRDKINRSEMIDEESEAPNREAYHPPLPSKERIDYSRAVDLFGQQTMRNLHSKKWHEHKKGLVSVQQKLESVSSTEASDYLDSTIAILQKHLRDPLYNVYATALDLLSFVCTKFMDRRSAGKTLSTMNEILEQDNKKKFRHQPIIIYAKQIVEHQIGSHFRRFAETKRRRSNAVLVSAMTSHKRNDCRAHDSYRTCPRCGESIERPLFHKHVGSKECRRE